MLLAVCIYFLVNPATAHAQMRYARYVTNAVDLVSMNPFGNDRIVFVRELGRFYSYDSTSAISTNSPNGPFKPSSFSGRWLELAMDYPSAINVKRLGAKCDGTTDDTAAVKAAHDSLYPGGGAIYIPGKCLFNLVVTNSNISLIGDGSIKDFTFPVPTHFWGPANTNNPVVQIGDDTRNVKGFSIHNATVYAPSGVIGIFFAGGTFEASAFNFTVWNFDTCLKFQDGAVHPCTGVNLFGFLIQSSPNAGARGIYAVDLAAGTYTTALHFIGGHINGHTGVDSYAVEIDSVYDVSFTDVYIDGTAEKCMYLNNVGGSLPVVTAHNLVLDIGGSTNSAVTLANNFAFPWNQLQGTIKTSGSFKLANGTYWPIKSAEFIGPLFYVPEVYSALQFARFPANTNSALEYMSADNDGNVLTHSGGNIILNADGHTIALPGGNLVMDPALGIYWGSDSFLSANTNRVFFLTTPTNAIIQAIDSAGQINTAVGGDIKASVDASGVSAGDSVHDPSAVLQANSITQGFLPPRLSTTQRDAIVAPALGLMIYNPTTGCIEFTNALGWRCLIDSGMGEGITNYIAKFTGPHSAGNSLLYQADTYGVQLLSQSSDNLGSYYELQKRGTTGDTNAPVASGATIGELRIRGWDGTDYGSTAAAISARAEEAFTTNGHGTKLVFETTGIGEVVRETAMELTSDQKVRVPVLTANRFAGIDGNSQLVATNFDVGIWPSSDGAGSIGLSSFRFSQGNFSQVLGFPIQPNGTAINHTLQNYESNTLWYPSTGSAVVMTLPAAGNGQIYYFISTGVSITINRAGSDVIRNVGTTGTSIVSTTNGSILVLMGYKSGEWVILTIQGTWTLT